MFKMDLRRNNNSQLQNNAIHKVKELYKHPFTNNPKINLISSRFSNEYNIIQNIGPHYPTFLHQTRENSNREVL
jgi:hypothetical protein